MIPYFEFPTYRLGPFQLQIFGVMAAVGIVVGGRLALRAMRRFGQDERPVADAIPWGVAGGLIGGHLMHIFGYHPEMLDEQGWIAILKFWEGLSSVGGLIGGVLATWIYLRVKGHRLLPYTDAFALGLAPGWAIARMGCFFVHDHPGRLTDFFLAVQFPGGARHDLGLYGMLVLAALSALLYWVARKPRPQGTLIGLLALLYGVARFLLDFLRATDLAYHDRRLDGLTPAQYVSIGLVIVGAFLLVRAWRLGRAEGAAAEDEGRPAEAAA